MINKCKVQIIMRDLYNVVESLKEEDEGCILCTQEIEALARYPFFVLISAIILSMHQTD